MSTGRIEMLIKQLKHADNRDDEIIMELQTLGDEAIKALVAGLSDEHPERRAAAARALGWLKVEWAIAHLARTAAYDYETSLSGRDQTPSSVAIKALKFIGLPAVGALVQLLNSDQDIIVEDVAWTLLNMGSPVAWQALIDRSNHPNPQIQVVARYAAKKQAQ